jgi:hypothetical protein
MEMPRLMLATDAPKRPRAARELRPARMIDDALRQRARDAVQRSLGADDSSEPSA